MSAVSAVSVSLSGSKSSLFFLAAAGAAAPRPVLSSCMFEAESRSDRKNVMQYCLWRFEVLSQGRGCCSGFDLVP